MPPQLLRCPICSLTSRILQPAPTPTRIRRVSSSPALTSNVAAKDILASPTWSVASLLSPPPSEQRQRQQILQHVGAEISPDKLHHLLRLSALPRPPTPAAESALLASLHSHLLFVRAVQAVDTTGVEPLRALRDETDRGRREATIGLTEIRSALESEVRLGHRRRPRRVRDKDMHGNDPEVRAAEDWQPLNTATRTAGKYFVVRSGKGEKA
ncbi:hypothetical protein SODALDRAFT_336768 [Sodiomyces alkalinus F11]|uniref:Glutamyl-tRNA amidotransferase complex subunit Gta3 domain-containing protein n=1 Tax=Sodiomyces alkalinus (strain CBS 110278 / VKM F-3762 / F11) TaxID=1314773 RepID=A0A3N2Q9H5_SODAK|nr:hypothetical protein SODALDRAFT_336768 [Sodiomyces alkalinus F11]ROT43413.1 hypothetical protein SODALDRAFT_336768 [Sodiomyces alkalinus F11]